MTTQITTKQAVQIAGDFLRMGQWVEAQDLYRRVLVAEPNNAAALHGMSRVSMHINRLDMTIQWLDRAIQADPSVAEYHRDLGEALRKSGMLELAIPTLERALKLKPDDEAAVRSHRMALAERRQLDSAPLPNPAVSRQYVIVTGYYNPGEEKIEDFFRLWYNNTMRFAKPKRIFVVNAASKPVDYGDCQWLNFSENLFHHVGVFPAGQQLSGFSASLMIGCLHAYHERADMLFKEQDCLAFGDYVQRLYSELGDKGMVAGPMLRGGQGVEMLSVSLMLVRHEYLLEFVARYLSLWMSDRELLPEHKLMEIARTGRIVESKMGYDRNRPVNYDDAGFHLQKITEEEMAMLRGKGLI